MLSAFAIDRTAKRMNDNFKLELESREVMLHLTKEKSIDLSLVEKIGPTAKVSGSTMLLELEIRSSPYIPTTKSLSSLVHGDTETMVQCATSLDPALLQALEEMLLKRGEFTRFHKVHLACGNKDGELSWRLATAAVQSMSLECVSQFWRTFRLIGHVCTKEIMLEEAISCEIPLSHGVNAADAHQWRLRVVHHLLTNEVNVAHGSSTLYPLIKAAKMGFVDIVALLSKHGASPHALKDLALTEACRNGHVSMVEYLLTVTGARVDVRDGETLVAAAAGGHVSVGWTLLKHGFSISKNVRQAPIFAAIENGHVPMIEFLLKDARLRWDVYDVLFFVHYHARPSLSTEILNCFRVALQGDEKERKNFDGIALRMAVKTGVLTAVQYLVQQCGVSLNEHDPKKLLSSASKRHSFGMVRFLVENGLNLSEHGEYAILKCLEYDMTLPPKLLLELGASISDDTRAKLDAI